MYITHSVRALAWVLSFSASIEALVVRRSNDNAVQEKVFARRGPSLRRGFSKRQGITEMDCPNDRWQEMLDTNPQERIVTFCNEWLDIAPATEVLEVTPTL